MSENVLPFSWESIHRLRVAPPADEEKRLYGREEGGVWDSEGGGDRGRQQTEDIRKIKFKPHYDCTVLIVLNSNHPPFC